MKQTPAWFECDVEVTGMSEAQAVTVLDTVEKKTNLELSNIKLFPSGVKFHAVRGISLGNTANDIKSRILKIASGLGLKAIIYISNPVRHVVMSRDAWDELDSSVRKDLRGKVEVTVPFTADEAEATEAVARLSEPGILGGSDLINKVADEAIKSANEILNNPDFPTIPKKKRWYHRRKKA